MFDVDKWPFFTPNTGDREVLISGRGPNGDASAIYIYLQHPRRLDATSASKFKNAQKNIF